MKASPTVLTGERCNGASRAIGFGPVGVVVLAGILLAAIVLAPLPLNGDTSWLLTVCERMLAGEIFGKDILEVNPPASAWLYMPAVAAAQAVGVSAEWTVLAMGFVVALSSIGLSDRLLARIPSVSDARWPVALASAFVFLLLPRDTFAQREHFALMMLTPIIMASCGRARGVAPHWPLALAAGLFAGVAVSIKPVLGGGPLFAALVAFACHRRLACLINVENLAAALAVGAYLIAAAAFAPAFFSVLLPVVVNVYLAEWNFKPDILLLLWAPALALAAPGLLGRRGVWREPQGMLVVASAGFMIAYVVQGKYWLYQAYPASGALIVASLVILAIGQGWRRVAAAWGALACALLYWSASAPMTSRITDIAKALEVEGPGLRVLTVLDDHAAAAPAIRAAGATSVGSLLNMWILDYTDRAGPPADRKAAADRAAARALAGATVRDDLARKSPDVIILQRGERDYLGLLRAEPGAAKMLEGYTPTLAIAHRKPLEIWVRRKPAAAPPQTPFDAGASAP